MAADGGHVRLAVDPKGVIADGACPSTKALEAPQLTAFVPLHPPALDIAGGHHLPFFWGGGARQGNGDDHRRVTAVPPKKSTVHAVSAHTGKQTPKNRDARRHARTHRQTDIMDDFVDPWFESTPPDPPPQLCCLTQDFLSDRLRLKYGEVALDGDDSDDSLSDFLEQHALELDLNDEESTSNASPQPSGSADYIRVHTLDRYPVRPSTTPSIPARRSLPKINKGACKKVPPALVQFLSPYAKQLDLPVRFATSSAGGAAFLEVELKTRNGAAIPLALVADQFVGRLLVAATVLDPTLQYGARLGSWFRGALTDPDSVALWIEDMDSITHHTQNRSANGLCGAPSPSPSLDDTSSGA